MDKPKPENTPSNKGSYWLGKLFNWFTKIFYFPAEIILIQFSSKSKEALTKIKTQYKAV
jgi:hypothetical protein